MPGAALRPLLHSLALPEGLLRAEDTLSIEEIPVTLAREKPQPRKSRANCSI